VRPNVFKRLIVAILRVAPRQTFLAINRFIAKVTEDRPVHRIERFEWAKDVAALHEDVRLEMARMLEHIEDMPTVHDIIPTTEYIFTKRNWRQVPFYLYGEKIDEHCELYPKTWEAFQRVKGLVVGSVSVLAPGEGVPLHDHTYKGLLIFHLGVIVPKERGGCGMRIGGEQITWDEGEVVVIDPTYAHETWNDTDHYRVLLLGELRRPDMPAWFKFMDHVFVRLYLISPIGKRLIRHAHAFAARHREMVRQSEKAVAQ
jgi:beta-hydroxylase